MWICEKNCKHRPIFGAIERTFLGMALYLLLAYEIWSFHSGAEEDFKFFFDK